MDGSIEISTLLAIAGAVSAIGGAWLTVRKIAKDLKKERDLESAKILQAAKEADAKMKADWEAARKLHLSEIDNKIASVEQRLNNLEESVAKDFSHVRETFNGEIRNLGEKIEDLRSDLHSQHGQLVALLTKMIDKD